MELIADNRTLRSKAERTPRCRTGRQAKAQERTACPAPDGFLRHRFSPVMAGMPEQLEDKEKIESDFFNSLANLQNLYSFEIEADLDLSYPCNIAAAWAEVGYQMAIAEPKAGIAILQSGVSGATIVTFKSFNTGNCLYYIPLEPLWRLLRDREYKPLAALLLSLYAYLYQTVGIPDYTRDDFSLYYTYQALGEWYREDSDTDKDAIKELKAAVRLAKCGGKSMVSKIKQQRHLNAFGKRLQAFHPSDKKVKEL
jgi:hypothetical protein